MKKNETTKLLKCVEGFSNDFDEKFDQVDKRFNDVMERLDILTKMITDYHQEILSLKIK